MLQEITGITNITITNSNFYHTPCNTLKKFKIMRIKHNNNNNNDISNNKNNKNNANKQM